MVYCHQLPNPAVVSDLHYFSSRERGVYPFGMLFDLGVEMMNVSSKMEFHKVLWKLDKDFHLVLILEQFDKSLLLLREPIVTGAHQFAKDVCFEGLIKNLRPKFKCIMYTANTFRWNDVNVCGENN